MLLNLLQQHGKDRIIVALDYLNNSVRIRGWTSSTQYTLEEAISKFRNLGIDQYLLTSISRDGLLIGPDYAVLRQITKHSNLKIIAAGGISTLEELKRLKDIDLAGVVIGKALYENRFTLQDAIQIGRE